MPSAATPSVSDLRDELLDVGADYPDDDGDAVWSTAAGLCAAFGMAAGELSEEWLAYSLTHNDAPFAQASMAGFEQHLHKERAVQKAAAAAAGRAKAAQPAAADRGGRKHTCAAVLAERSLLHLYGDGREEGDTAGGGTGALSPERHGGGCELVTANEATRALSPDRKDYRSNESGKVLLPYKGGRYEPPAEPVERVQLSVHNADEMATLRSFYQTPMDAFAAISSRIDAYADSLPLAEGEVLNSMADLQSLKNRGALFVGQIGGDHDAADGDDKENDVEAAGGRHRLTAENALLQGSFGDGNAASVPMHIGSMQRCSFFPGQIAALSGTVSADGRTFDVTGEKLADLPPLAHVDAGVAVSMVVASGPFGMGEPGRYGFEPLYALLDVVRQSRPHILCLMGPMIDVMHPTIKQCLYDKDYQSAFGQVLTEIKAKLNGQSIDVLVQCCTRDAHSLAIYPCPSAASSSESDRADGDTGECVDETAAATGGSVRVHCVGDPAVVRIAAGLDVTLCAEDCLKHLAAAELAKGEGGERVSRLLMHVLRQRRTYPVYPPPPAAALNIDLANAERLAVMERRPHVLLAASDLRYFVKEVAGSLCVNAGRVCRTGAKALGSGTYATLRIAVPDAGATSVADCAQVHVVKL